MDCVALSSSDLCSSSSSGAAGGARVPVRVDQTYRDHEVQKDSQGNEGLTASALVTVVDLRQKTSGPASAALKPSLLARAILVVQVARVALGVRPMLESIALQCSPSAGPAPILPVRRARGPRGRGQLELSA